MRDHRGVTHRRLGRGQAALQEMRVEEPLGLGLLRLPVLFLHSSLFSGMGTAVFVGCFLSYFCVWCLHSTRLVLVVSRPMPQCRPPSLRALHRQD